MDVMFHLNPGATHQFEHAAAFKQGMKKHGVIARDGHHDTFAGAEVSVIWSWKQPKLIEAAQQAGKHILVMERGFLPNRMDWCSLSIDGMNGLGTAPSAPSSDRWDKHFSHLLKPWKEGNTPNDALIIGQVPGDPTLYGTDMFQWVDEMIAELAAHGYGSIFRCHPYVQNKINRGELPAWNPKPPVLYSTATLEEDFARTSLVVTFSSNTGVEAILNGIPTMALHPGSMVYNLSSQDFTNPQTRPDRASWCNDMGYRQWTMDELSNGTAWDFVRQGLR